MLLCMSATASAQTSTHLHTFTGATGGGTRPIAALVQGRDGLFYGVTRTGGTADLGTVFRMSANGSVTTLHSFLGGADGATPTATLIQARDGNFYGTASEGGSHNQGVAFVMTLAGTLTVLHTFSGGLDGGSVLSELVEGRDGNFYGTTAQGGSANCGTIFKMTPDGTLTTLHAFPGASGGAGPHDAGLVQTIDGNFYGTTGGGGTAGMGTVFRMTPEGTVTTLHSFPGPPDGAFPSGTLVQAVDGNFYGTTSAGASTNMPLPSGTVFRVTPAGAVTILHRFTNLVEFGAMRGGRLLAASDLHLYGTSHMGSLAFPLLSDYTYDFRMSLAGEVEFLAPFQLVITGQRNPLIEARDGNLYGTWTGSDVNSFGTQMPGEARRLSGAMPCNDKLTVSYQAGTLNLGFTVGTTEPAIWSAWLALAGPPEQTGLLWSAPIAVTQPARFVNLPIPGFPSIGPLFVLTAVQQSSGRVCADWKLVDTGP
jgi:uncharacterized repeat protein (TIGR03803 family)